MNDQCTWQRPGGRCLRDAGHPGPHRSQADYAAMPASTDDEAAIRDALAHNTARREQDPEEHRAEKWAALREENARLREALALYADEEAWQQMLAGQGGLLAEAGPTVAAEALTSRAACCVCGTAQAGDSGTCDQCYARLHGDHASRAKGEDA